MGGRSSKAVRDLEDKYGFQNLYSLIGGIVAYMDEVNQPIRS